MSPEGDGRWGMDGIDDDGCPFDCRTCPSPGDCEDCQDCLEWGLVLPEPSPGPRLPAGRSSPLRSHELAAARAQLEARHLVGLVLRRARRDRQLSQAALAREVDWPASSLGRLEQDAGATPLAKVDSLLRLIGHRLVVAPVDSSPADGPAEPVWGTEELLVTDRRGRRPPPFAVVTWEDPLDRTQYPRHGRPLGEWTWRRPS